MQSEATNTLIRGNQPVGERSRSWQMQSRGFVVSVAKVEMAYVAKDAQVNKSMAAGG